MHDFEPNVNPPVVVAGVGLSSFLSATLGKSKRKRCSWRKIGIRAYGKQLLSGPVLHRSTTLFGKPGAEILALQ